MISLFTRNLVQAAYRRPPTFFYGQFSPLSYSMACRANRIKKSLFERYSNEEICNDPKLLEELIDDYIAAAPQEEEMVKVTQELGRKAREEFRKKWRKAADKK